MQERYFVFVLLCYFLYSPVVTGLDVYVDGVYWNTLRATGLRLKDDNIHIEGRLIRGQPFSGCKPFENKDEIQQLIDQNETVIVVTSTRSDGLINCGEEVRLRNVKDTGAVAMMYASQEYAAGYGINAYAINGEQKVQDVNILGIDMEENVELDDMLKDGTKVIRIVIDGEDANLWWVNRAFFATITILLDIANFGILLLIILRLSQFIRKYGPQPSIPQICLWLEVVGSIMRILYFVDPSFCRGVWPLAFAAFLNFTHVCWSLAAALLLTFYWEEVMRAAHIQAFPKLAKMKLPAIISISILFTLSVICAIIRMTYINAETAVVNTIIQIVYTAPVAGFFCYGGVRILRTLYHSKSVSKSTENLRKVTLMLVGIAACFAIRVLFLILFAAVPFSMPWFMTNRCIVWTSQTIETLCLVMSFQNPFTSSTSGSASSVRSQSKPRTLSSDVEMAFSQTSGTDSTMHSEQ